MQRQRWTPAGGAWILGWGAALVLLIGIALWQTPPGSAQEPRLRPGTPGTETSPPAEEAQRKTSTLLTALGIPPPGGIVCTTQPVDPSQNVHVVVCNTTPTRVGDTFRILTVYCDARSTNMVCWLPPGGGF